MGAAAVQILEKAVLVCLRTLVTEVYILVQSKVEWFPEHKQAGLEIFFFFSFGSIDPSRK